MGIWNELLRSFESSRPPKKTLLLLGGSPKTQNSFIQKLYIEEDSFLTSIERNPISNEFGLGYTFIEYIEDTGELLSTLQIYTLPGDFKPHYKQLLTTFSSNLKAQDLLVIPILDYTEDPHSWIRSLQSWLSVLQHLYYESNHERLLENYKAKFNNFEKFDAIDVIGVDVLIAVLNTETRPDWEHSVFEYIQLVVRIISLKHGFSLIYSPLLRSDQRIAQLISSLLDIETTHKSQQKLEPNLVDHTEILVPGGIDSWGKIKTLNDDIEPSKLSQEWGLASSEMGLIEDYERIVPNQSPNPVIKENGGTDLHAAKDVSFQEFLTNQYEKQHRSREKILNDFIHDVQSRTEDGR